MKSSRPQKDAQKAQLRPETNRRRSPRLFPRRTRICMRLHRRWYKWKTGENGENKRWRRTHSRVPSRRRRRRRWPSRTLWCICIESPRPDWSRARRDTRAALAGPFHIEERRLKRNARARHERTGGTVRESGRTVYGQAMSWAVRRMGAGESDSGPPPLEVETWRVGEAETPLDIGTAGGSTLARWGSCGITGNAARHSSLPAPPEVTSYCFGWLQWLVQRCACDAG